MAYNYLIPEFHSLGKLLQLFTETPSFLNSLPSGLLFSTRVGRADKENNSSSESEEVPLPEEGEIYPNRDVPGEEEYLPDEEEVTIEEPPKEIEDPYFPGKNDELPGKKGEEFPQTDPS